MKFIACPRLACPWLRVGDRGIMRQHKLRLVGQTVLVMKLALFLLTAAICTASANVMSQPVTDTSANASVEEVITAVKIHTGYVFFYQKKTIKDARKIN